MTCIEQIANLKQHGQQISPMSDSVQRQAFISLPGISMVEGHWMHSPRPSYLDLTISIASFWQAWHSNVRFCEPGPSGSVV